MLIKMNDSFALGGDGILWYQDRLCVPDVDDLRTRIVAEAHSSRCYIHPRSTKMYHEFKKIYWLDGIKKDIAQYVSKCRNCQQVMVEHLKPAVLLGLLRFRIGIGRP